MALHPASQRPRPTHLLTVIAHITQGEQVTIMDPFNLKTADMKGKWPRCCEPGPNTKHG